MNDGTHEPTGRGNLEREMFGRSMADTAKVKLTQQDWRKAGVVVVREAQSVEEARELLDMLGIPDQLKGQGATSSTSMPLFNSHEVIR